MVWHAPPADESVKCEKSRVRARWSGILPRWHPADRLDHLDRLVRLARLDRLDPLDPLDRLDQLELLDRLDRG